MIFPPEEAIEYIKRFALLPLLLSVFERDRKLIDSSPIKTKEPYLALMDKAIKRIEVDLYETKLYFYKNGIKVYEEDRTDGNKTQIIVSGLLSCSELSIRV